MSHRHQRHGLEVAGLFLITVGAISWPLGNLTLAQDRAAFHESETVEASEDRSDAAATQTLEEETSAESESLGEAVQDRTQDVVQDVSEAVEEALESAEDVTQRAADAAADERAEALQANASDSAERSDRQGWLGLLGLAGLFGLFGKGKRNAVEIHRPHKIPHEN